MKKIALITLMLSFITLVAYCNDYVYTKGYLLDDGTYVLRDTRPKPEGYRWDNYGPSQNESQRFHVIERDYDCDGIPNIYDFDDDNDGITDDYDASQYGGRFISRPYHYDNYGFGGYAYFQHGYGYGYGYAHDYDYVPDE